ncbi:hypothetical protein T12_3580 [Trichinella patagoniensis]|uniref:Uncharacterized protein n=1 Tax=Trichinella patagoniensis TaxID=990121 RepID=A0A0V1AGE1_9BILA|nr:hypothetical protein T12_3580 [Trichinella patagoniensis]
MPFLDRNKLSTNQYRPQVVIKIRKSQSFQSDPIRYPILSGSGSEDQCTGDFLVDNDNQVPVDCIINPRFDYLNH